MKYNGFTYEIDGKTKYVLSIVTEQTEYFTNYYEAEKRAKQLKLKLAEYGDNSNGVAYCYWNKTGNRNDEAIVYVEYCWSKDGKPIPLERGNENE